MGRLTIFLGAFILTVQLWGTLGGIEEDKLNEFWNIFSTSWPRYEKTTNVLHEMEQTFPENVKIYSIGKTVQDREMWVIKLSQDVSGERPVLVTPLKLVVSISFVIRIFFYFSNFGLEMINLIIKQANMHGDETLGRALLHMLSVDILTKYHNGEPRARRLMENTELHILASMNTVIQSYFSSF